METNFPKRKNMRLCDFDYSKHGAYFITVCTEGKRRILSEIMLENIADADVSPDEIVGEGSPLPQLSPYGEIVDRWIKNIPQKYPNVSIERYVIMPNHIHLLLFLYNGGRGDPAPTVGSVVGWFKYQSTREINEMSKTIGRKIFQRSFYDHIIRNQHDYDEVTKYIYENPMKWRFDKLNEKTPH